jgi:hypothetical protein
MRAVRENRPAAPGWPYRLAGVAPAPTFAFMAFAFMAFGHDFRIWRGPACRDGYRFRKALGKRNLQESRKPLWRSAYLNR